VLASSPTMPHNANMVDAPLIAIEIQIDPLNATRFRWAVREGSQMLLRSPQSYLTRGEAEKEATDARKRVEIRHQVN
jgi:hypothetical protein